jgi:hypothetical protein
MTDEIVPSEKLNPLQLTEFLKAEKVRWKNRRNMAWVSLFAIIGQTLLLILMPPSILSLEKIQILKEPLTWAYMCESAIILGYMGFTTWAYLKEKYSTIFKVGD